MNSKTFVAPNISCGHCVHTIENEVAGLGGVTYIKADLASKQVVVRWDAPADWDKISTFLDEIGYRPQELLQLN